MTQTAVAAQAPASLNASQADTAQAAARARSSADYGKLPLSFEENRGQASRNVRYVARGDGYAIALGGRGATLLLSGSGKCDVHEKKAASQNLPCIAQSDEIRMTLPGSQASGKMTPEEQLPGKVNYFLGSDPTGWQTDFATYAKVRYNSVYPGVDLVYYGNQGQLEYDFVVSPGAKASSIRINLQGEKGLRLGTNGDLILTGNQGSASFHKPVIYQEIDGRRLPVAGSFTLATAHTVGFSIGTYDRTRPLIIDPILSYSTLLGGSGNNYRGDTGNGIAIDAAGNAYVVGTTYSSDFPTTAGAFQKINKSQLDNQKSQQDYQHSTVFISKMNSTGTALLYSTYLGGTGSSAGGDFGYGIAVDAAGTAYVTGTTYSSNFPVTCGTLQTENPSTTAGAPTGYVTRINSSGNKLLYSTYLGGSGNQISPAYGDVPQGIALDSLGDANIVGYTYSADFPVTTGAAQTDYSGSAAESNAFVSKLNPSGAVLLYSTYLGGGGSAGAGDYGNAIALNAQGAIAIVGTTSSSNFPVTTNAYESSARGFPTAFVAVVNPAGQGSKDLTFSTYFGGSGGDTGQAIAVDAADSLYFGGNTTSSDIPLTAGVVEGSNVPLGQYYNNVNGGGAFIAKFRGTDYGLAYSTYFEGQSTTVAGIAADAAGNVYVTGATQALGAGSFGSFQATPDALPVSSAAPTAAYLVSLDPAASVFRYATLLGGSTSYDGAKALAMDQSSNAYIAGYSGSSDFLVTSGAFQSINKSATPDTSNAFLGRFALAGVNNTTTYPTVVPSNIATSMNGSGGFNVECDPNQGQYSVYVSASMTPAAFGPPPTGTIEIDSDITGPGNQDPIIGYWGWGASDSVGYTSEDPPYGGPFTINWSAEYSGDSIYQPSSTTGSFQGTGCTYPDSSRSKSAASSGSSVTPKLSGSKGTHTTLTLPVGATAAQPRKAAVQGPKFVPEASATTTGSAASIARSSAAPAPAAACVLSKPPLTITLHVSSGYRVYGQANPTFSDAISGLQNGDTVNVAIQTTATPASPVGSYPVTATVTGAALANYTLTVLDSTILVRPATLAITAQNESVVYGQTPAALTGYKLTGFVGADSASVVLGGPGLSTTVTSTTPVGIYPISVGVGNFTAANYVFTTKSNGPGSVEVFKAPLQLTANSLTMTQGSSVPTLTYSLTGFVNGDTSSVVAGAPTLSTTATSSSRPGSYPIVIEPGSLSTANYSFKKVNGVLTVTP